MTGQRKRLSNWPQNQNGKRSLNQIALASDLGAHAKMLSNRYSSRFRDDHDMCWMQISPAASITHLNTPVNNPPVDDLAEVEVTDPSHPLYGRRFALLSTRPRPHSVGYLFVVYRDTMVLRIPQAATSLVMAPEPQPMTKLTSHA